VELRDALAEIDDLVVVYVLPDVQVNAKTLRFFDEAGLHGRVLLAVDVGSRSIDRLGIRRPDPGPMEEGVPHPTTLLLDRQGVVRMLDLREDFHIWIDPQTIVTALQQLP
jgi:peroxiredoxin